MAIPRSALRDMAETLQDYGRNGDTILAHINPVEAAALKRMGGSGTRNPDTGLLEFSDMGVGESFSGGGQETGYGSDPGASTESGDSVTQSQIDAYTQFADAMAQTGGKGGLTLGGVGGEGYGDVDPNWGESPTAQRWGQHAGWLGRVAGRVVDNPIASLINAGVSFIPGIGQINTLVGLGTGIKNTAGGLLTAAARSIGEKFGLGEDRIVENPVENMALQTPQGNPFDPFDPTGLGNDGRGGEAPGQPGNPRNLLASIASGSTYGTETQPPGRQLRTYNPNADYYKIAYNKEHDFFPGGPWANAATYAKGGQVEGLGDIAELSNMTTLVRHIAPIARELLAGDSKGLKEYARGGSTGFVPGDSGGMDDKIPAKLSDGEYVIDAHTVAALGDGNNAAGAKKLDEFRERIRRETWGKTQQPDRADPKVDL